MGEHCVVIRSELLDSFVFPVSLHSVLLRSGIYSLGLREVYMFFLYITQVILSFKLNSFAFDLHQCIRDIRSVFCKI